MTAANSPDAQADDGRAVDAVGRYTWIRLSDGTMWPRPALERDEQFGVAWTLTHGAPTRSDLIHAASIVNAYGYLLTMMTAERRALVVREIRASLAAEGDPSRPATTACSTAATSTRSHLVLLTRTACDVTGTLGNGRDED